MKATNGQQKFDYRDIIALPRGSVFGGGYRFRGSVSGGLPPPKTGVQNSYHVTLTNYLTLIHAPNRYPKGLTGRLTSGKNGYGVT